MKSSQIIKQITSIEKGLDPDQDNLIWEGIHIWPIVREILFHTIKNDLAYASINNFLLYNRLSWKESLLQQLQQKYRGTAILFFSRNSDNREWVGENRYNALIDPLFETFSAQFECAKFEIVQPQDHIQDSHLHPPQLITLKRSRQHVLDQENTFKTFFEPLRGKIINEIQVDLHSTIVLHHLLVIKEYAYFFKELLSPIQPEAVFFVCCKSLPVKGLILACRELNIAAVDIQHGFQGNSNIVYHHWENWPRKGYNLLPTHFWAWGDIFAHNIDKWFSRFNSSPIVIQGGYLWPGMWSKGTSIESKKQLTRLTALKEKKPYRKVILLTTRIISEELLSAIRHLPKNWLWLFRSHPQFGMDTEDLEQLLLEYGIDNYNIDFASNASLYLLLKHCDAHITFDSTVAFEAYLCNNQSIILDKEGFDMFSDFHDSGAFIYAKSQDSICSYLQKIVKNKADLSSYPKRMIDDKESALSGIYNILEHNCKSNPQNRSKAQKILSPCIQLI